jgi:hypothetical protein
MVPVLVMVIVMVMVMVMVIVIVIALALALEDPAVLPCGTGAARGWGVLGRLSDASASAIAGVEHERHHDHDRVTFALPFSFSLFRRGGVREGSAVRYDGKWGAVRYNRIGCG